MFLSIVFLSIVFNKATLIFVAFSFALIAVFYFFPKIAEYRNKVRDAAKAEVKSAVKYAESVDNKLRKL